MLLYRIMCYRVSPKSKALNYFRTNTTRPLSFEDSEGHSPNLKGGIYVRLRGKLCILWRVHTHTHTCIINSSLHVKYTKWLTVIAWIDALFSFSFIGFNRAPPAKNAKMRWDVSRCGFLCLYRSTRSSSSLLCFRPTYLCIWICLCFFVLLEMFCFPNTFSFAIVTTVTCDLT